jgi:hypothetical protein
MCLEVLTTTLSDFSDIGDVLYYLADSSSSSAGSAEASNSAESFADENVPPADPAGYDNVSPQIRASTTSLYFTQSEPPVYTR